MTHLPGAIVAPEAKIMVTRGVRREVIGHHIPGATGSQDIKDAVDDLVKGVFTGPARSPLCFGLGKEGFHECPLVVG